VFSSHIEFKVCVITCSKGTKGNAYIEIGGFRVTQGHWQCQHLIKRYHFLCNLNRNCYMLGFATHF